MGFFQDLKEELSQAVNELIPDDKSLLDKAVKEEQIVDSVEEQDSELHDKVNNFKSLDNLLVSSSPLTNIFAYILWESIPFRNISFTAWSL